MKLLKKLFAEPIEKAKLDNKLKEELRLAIELKKLADAYNMPIKISIPSLNIEYWYDPIEARIKKKKLELLSYLTEKAKKRYESEKLGKIIQEVDLL